MSVKFIFSVLCLIMLATPVQAKSIVSANFQNLGTSEIYGIATTADEAKCLKKYEEAISQLDTNVTIKDVSNPSFITVIFPDEKAWRKTSDELRLRLAQAVKCKLAMQGKHYPNVLFVDDHGLAYSASDGEIVTNTR